MFRSCVTKASRCLASTSRAELHTSTVCRAKIKAETPVESDSKIQAKLERKQAKDAARIYAVLGSAHNKEDKWPTCDLAKTILTQDALYSKTAEDQVLTLPEGSVTIPPHLNYGIGEGEGKKLLFEVLPALVAEHGATNFDENTVKETEAAIGEELQKANMFAKLVDLRNANAQGIAFENRRRVVAAFSTPEKPNDPGRPEVQAALLTMQIRNLWSHLIRFRKDVDNRRALRRLVHQRAKVLRYLKRSSLDRYEALLPRLGLEEASVEGELLI
ncbi:hypothetical protein HYDPIDRAFT_26837 [Hydnomerulius pinastri MD-312]|nr:hypothetical protein HYDPIDRAFT_26837 [Hydnomerulius pinastri MD-312]